MKLLKTATRVASAHRRRPGIATAGTPTGFWWCFPYYGTAGTKQIFFSKQVQNGQFGVIFEVQKRLASFVRVQINLKTGATTHRAEYGSDFSVRRLAGPVARGLPAGWYRARLKIPPNRFSNSFKASSMLQMQIELPTDRLHFSNTLYTRQYHLQHVTI